MARNELTEFPNNLIAMTALRELRLGYNSISKIEPEV
jgi:hypothetical protein